MTQMARLHKHAEALYDDLGRLADGDAAEIGEPLTDVYNTLLTLAKKASPNDPIIEALNPVTKSMKPLVVQALTAQLGLVLGNT